MQVSQAAFHRVTVGAVQSGALSEQGQATPLRRTGTDRIDREDVRGPEGAESAFSADLPEKVQGPSRTRRGHGQEAQQEAHQAGRSGRAETPARRAGAEAGEESWLNPGMRAALADNSRELQVRFELDRGQQPRGPEPGSRGAPRQMIDRMARMTRDRIAQYVGDEPYTRSDYRALQGALETVRGQYDRDLGPERRAEPQDPWEASSRREGPALESGMEQAGEVLSWFGPEPDPEPELSLDLVA